MPFKGIWQADSTMY